MQFQLDRDVYQIIRKYQHEVDDVDPGRITSSAIYQYITSSNSTLRRQKKVVLLGSIDRVTKAHWQDDAPAPDSDYSGADDSQQPVILAEDVMNRAIRGNLGVTPLMRLDAPTSAVNGVDQAKPPTSVKRQPPRDEEVAPKRRKTSDKTWVAEPNGLILEDLAGIDSIVDELTELVAFPMLHPHIYLESGISPTRGILLHGPPGCGKTALANAFANRLSVAFISVSAPSLVGGMSGESEKSIRDLFAEARKQAPCLVFIDEIDAIIPKRESAQREMEKRIVAQMLTCMDDLSLQKTGGKPVVVMAATNRPDSLDEAMRRAGRFNKEINMPVPDLLAREQILKAMTRNLQTAADVDFGALAKLTPGYVGADLSDLVSTAGVMSIKRSMADINSRLADAASAQDLQSNLQMADLSPIPPILPPPTTALTRLDRLLRSRDLAPPSTLDLQITQADLTTSLSKIQPSSLREGFATVPRTTFAEIGGNASLRRTLELSIIYQIRSPSFYAQVGIAAPSGVLLWGPPGCGKTLLAKAVANESGANFISVKGPELLNKYVGESEKAVRKLFERARSSVPVLIFFDELDALVPRRDGGGGSDGGSGGTGNEASSRVVNTLLAELDGVGSSRAGIYIIAATNRPDILDGAMLRPGRLDRCCFVDLPDEEERAAILTALVKDRVVPVRPDALGGGLLKAVAGDERTKGMSGADLVAVLKAAGVAALRRHYGEEAMGARFDARPLQISVQEQSVGPGQGQAKHTSDGEKLWVLAEDFEEALQEIKPSVTDIGRYRALARSPKWGGDGKQLRLHSVGGT